MRAPGTARARLESPPHHVRYGTLRQRGPTGDGNQVGVGVERQGQRIEWPRGLSRRRRQSGEPRLRQSQRGGGKRRDDETSTIEHLRLPLVDLGQTWSKIRWRADSGRP
jgi:hypothetical protein